MEKILKTFNNIYVLFTKSKFVLLDGYNLKGGNDNSTFGNCVTQQNIFTIASTITSLWPDNELEELTFGLYENIEVIYWNDRHTNELHFGNFGCYAREDITKITHIVTYPHGLCIDFETYCKNLYDKFQKEKGSIELSNTKFEKIIELFDSVDLKKPVLRVEIGGVEIVIKKAEQSSANPNYLYVRVDDLYAGKISPEGIFTNTWDQRVLRMIDIDSMKKCLQQLNENPKQKLIEYGKKSGKCGCCGRKLMDPTSIELGIGPICLDNWGM